VQAEPVCSAAELSGLLQSRCNIKACLKRQIEVSWVRSHGCQLRQLAACCSLQVCSKINLRSMVRALVTLKVPLAICP
jgi:hypothetical protein